MLTLTPFLVYAIGQPVAFISGKNVFSRSGRFVGLLDGKEVWHGSYKGEIVKQNRFLQHNKGLGYTWDAGHSWFPRYSGDTRLTGSISLPGGYRDVKLGEND